MPTLHVDESFVRVTPCHRFNDDVMTKDEMKKATDKLYPDGYLVVEKDTKKLYVYEKDADPTEETWKFKEVTGEGWGGTGTLNYLDLENKPKINGVILSWDKTSADLNIEAPDMSDYYTKQETNEALNLKANTSDVYNKNNTYTKQEVNDLIPDTTNFATKQELNSKQDNLVSWINIKTVNGKDITGAWNVEIEGGVTIDDILSTTSENPVQNKVINNALSAKANTIDVYNKNDIDTRLNLKANSNEVYNKTETYNKTELDTSFSTINTSLTALYNTDEQLRTDIQWVDAELTQLKNDLVIDLWGLQQEIDNKAGKDEIPTIMTDEVDDSIYINSADGTEGFVMTATESGATLMVQAGSWHESRDLASRGYVDDKTPTIVNEGATFTNAAWNQKMKIRTGGQDSVIIKDTNWDWSTEYWSHELPNKNYVDTEIQSKINDAISWIIGFTYEIVNALPTQWEKWKIYLVENASQEYDEYIWLEWDPWKFEKIGSVNNVDLSNYYNKTETDTLLNAKANSLDVYNKSEIDTELAKKWNANTSFDNEYKTLLLRDVNDSVELQIVKGTSNDYISVNEYAEDDRWQMQQIFDMNLPSKDYVDANIPTQATDTTTGTIKLNPNENININENWQLTVGGRLWQTAEGGLYSPVSANPTIVDKNALLLSDMSGLSVSNGALALLRGANVNVKSAAPGTTEYHVANTYLNRLQCVGLQYTGAVCIINEDAEPTWNFSNILSCKINGASFTPNSNWDDPDNDIIITVDKTCNPDTTVTQIRCYTAATKSSSFYAGQMVWGYSGLANVIVGQSVFTNTGNVVAMIAAQSYNNWNGNAIFWRYHNSLKNRWFMSGTWHDTTNGRTESGAVVWQYSDIKPDTLFAVWNGTDHLNRSNAFEVTEGGISLPSVQYLEIKDKNLAPVFNTTNYSKTAAITIAGDVATFPDNATALYLTKKSPAIPVTEGEVINWSYEVRKTSEDVVCNQGLNLLKTNATGGSATNNLVRDEPASSYTTEWQTVKWTFTVPAWMEYMTPRLQKTMPSGGTATSGAYEVRNLQIIKPDSALVLSSPNGTRYKIVVADDGTLSTVAV